MDKIVYRGLTDLILDERSMDVEELVKEAHKRYGFDQHHTRVGVLVAIAVAEDSIVENPSGAFAKKNQGSVYTAALLGYLENSNGVLEDPGMKKFYEDFKKRFASGSPEQ